MIRILPIILIFLISACTQNKEVSVPSPTATVDIKKDTIDISKLSIDNNYVIDPPDIIDLGVANASTPYLEKTLTIENTSNQTLSLNFNFPTKNGFLVKKNECLGSLAKDQKCIIVVGFQNQSFQFGDYFSSLEIYDDNSSISSIFKVRVNDNEHASNLQSELSVILSETFAFGSNLPYRKISIKNTSLNIAKLNFQIPIGYSLRLNDCPSNLKPNDTCFIDVMYTDYKNTSATLGILNISGNFTAKNINLLSLQSDISYSPQYSDYVSNVPNACDGQGLDTRTLIGCRLLIRGIDYADADLSYCSNYNVSTLLQKIAKSPAGIKTEAIENGERKTNCLLGQTTGTISYVCNSNSHEESNSCKLNIQSCPIIGGSGQRTWTGSAYGPCLVSSCNAGFHEENNSCQLNTYIAEYDDNPLQSCGGAITFSPLACLENWGGHNITDMSYCLGMTKTYQSPPGIKYTNITNGSQLMNCALGQTSGAISYQCNSGYHNEGNSCISNVQSCNTAPNATAGIKTWNGSDYGICVATGCNSGYHLNNGSCQQNTYIATFPPNNLTPCDGVLTNISPISCRESWGNQNATDLSNCSGQTVNYQSPEGNKNIPISNGYKTVFCSQGQTTQNLVSTTCNDEALPTGYHLYNGSCQPNRVSCSSLPLGTTAGYQEWNGSNYGICVASSCNSPSYRLESGACIVANYLPIFPTNNLAICGGTRTVNPIECKENWGSLETTSLSNCSGMTEIQKSPAGTLYENISDGQKLKTCIEGSNSESISYLCNANYHSESNQCLPDIKSCEVSTLLALNALAGIQTWNGSGYDSCQLSSCQGQFNLDGTGYHLSNNSCISNTQSCDSAELIALNASNGSKVWNGSSYGSCQINSCNGQYNVDGTGYHQVGNSCISNTDLCTGAELAIINALTGTKFWDGVSTFSSCFATSCNGQTNTDGSGYHLNNGTCLMNTSNCSGSELSLLNAITGLKKWNGTNAYGSCEATSCMGETNSDGSGYHKEGSICVNNTQNCSSGELSAINALTGVKKWNGSSSYSSCQATSCSGQTNTNGTGYHINGNVCENNTISCTSSELSALNATNGNKYWNGSTSYGSCQINSCIGESNIDGTGYHKSGNTCVDNTISCSSAELTALNAIAGIKVWNGSSYSSCQVISCNGQTNTDGTGQHYSNGTCVDNTISCTSTELTSMNASSGSKIWDGSTSYGLCQINSCNGESNIDGSGYHKSGNTCTANSISCSGSELSILNANTGLKIWNGSTYGSCQILSCTGQSNLDGTGYHLSGNSCVSNSEDCSNAELTSLNASSGVKYWNGFIYGSCLISTCLSNYYYQSNSCNLKTYIATFPSNTTHACEGSIVVSASTCKEAWGSQNLVDNSYCSDQTVTYQSPAGNYTYSIPHGTRTDTCSAGSSTPTNTIVNCTENGYVSRSNQCVYNNSPVLSGSVNIGSIFYQLQTPSVTFSPATDPELDSVYYEYSLGLSAGGTEIVSWSTFSPSGTTTLSYPFFIIPSPQIEDAIIYINIRSKDFNGAISNVLTGSYINDLGWPYGNQTDINGSSGNCVFLDGDLTVSSGTCNLVAGKNYDFRNVTINSGATLALVYDSTLTYNIDPSNNPGLSVATNGVQKYSIIGVSQLFTNNGTFIAKGNPFIHTQSMTNPSLKLFTIPMPSGSYSGTITGVGIPFSLSGNGSTYSYQDGQQYSSTNAYGVPFSNGGVYGGGGGGITLDGYYQAGGSNSSNGPSFNSGKFWDFILKNMNVSSIGMQGGNSPSMNGNYYISTSLNMAAGGNGGISLINRYFNGSGGSVGIAKIFDSVYGSQSTFPLLNGDKNKYGGGGGGARGSNGQLVVIHSHQKLTGNGIYNLSGENGGGGGNPNSCEKVDAYNSSLVSSSCLDSGSGVGGNGAGGSGGKLYIVSPSSTSYISSSNIVLTGGSAGVGGNGGSAGSIGSTIYKLAK